MYTILGENLVIHIKIAIYRNCYRVAWKQTVVCPGTPLCTMPALPTREAPSKRMSFCMARAKHLTYAELTSALSLGFVNCEREKERFGLLLCGWIHVT